MKAIEVERLTKRYGSARGVEDLSFSIERGEIFGYLGPNGSGKTTTIRCLMGLLQPSSGQCRLLGQRVEPGRGTQHAKVGYLPGEFRIWPGRPARKSLRLLARLGNGNHPDRRQEELAERLDLDLNRRVGTLSKGNRQKVGVIHAFQHQPEVLILDEPTIGLDPLVRQVVMELVREAAEAGATVLLSSHDLSEVAAVCGRAAILREGRLVELAAVSEIVRKGERHLRVWFLKGTEISAPLANVPPGIRIVRQDAGSLQLAYHGAADAAIKWLAKLPVDRIATPETSLEDAFIQYYRRENTHEG